MSTVVNSAEIDPFDMPPVHAIVRAQAGCAPAGIASSVFDWRGAVPAKPDRSVSIKVANPVANPLSLPPVQEPTMNNPSTAGAAAPASATGSAGPRFRLLAVLAAHGVMQREQIASDTGLKAHRLSQVICEAKKANMLRRLNDGVYEITDSGRAYVMADHAGADAKFAKPRQAQLQTVTKATPVIAGGGGGMPSLQACQATAASLSSRLAAASRWMRPSTSSCSGICGGLRG